MPDTEVKFKREGLEGVVAVGSYLIDIAKRFGVHFDDLCAPEMNEHFCAVVITSGSVLLSGETRAEKDYFLSNQRKTHERLACQAKIEKAGEIVIMTREKAKDQKSEKAADDNSEQYRKEFEEMPLEKKIANLVRLETIALGETVSFIMNSPFKIADMMMGVMAEFGIKKEEQQKTAVRPDEHKSDTGSKGSSKKKSRSVKPEKPATE